MNRPKKILLTLLLLLIIFASVLFMLSLSPTPEKIIYGTSFSKLHADELGLDWKQVFLATLDDLQIRHFRLSAHWNQVEPENNVYDFSFLDFQMKEAGKRDADVILSVGRRLPGWPECHEPKWAQQLSKEEKQQELLSYVENIVRRYKDYPNLRYWQIENEVFLGAYAKYFCGNFFDVDFFEKEIALVRGLDPNTPIFLTDSGELSLWKDAYKRADVFGTSLYLYVWNHYLGPIRYPITPAFFRIKHSMVKLVTKDPKNAIISELSLEPWLLQPISVTPLDEQLARMDLNRFNEIIKFASKTGFDTQYLWGVEWWYYMKDRGHPEFWERAKQLLKK